MPRLVRSDIILLVLAAGAAVTGALGFAGLGETAANSLLFAASALVLLALFILAIRLPLRVSVSR